MTKIEASDDVNKRKLSSGTVGNLITHRTDAQLQPPIIIGVKRATFVYIYI